jgi:phospholipase/lecithinase/hemolysin
LVLKERSFFYTTKFDCEGENMLGRNLNLRSRLGAWLVMVVFAAMQVACGGSSDYVAMTVPVSSGYPILGSTVTLKGSNGVAVSALGDSVTGVASFTASQIFTLGNPPYLVKSTGGKANNVSAGEYYSIATASSGRFNVTPITHLLAVQATGAVDSVGMASLFATGFTSAKSTDLTSTKIANAGKQVADALKATNPFIDLGSTNPLTVDFSFGDAQDALLDHVALAIKSNTGATLDTIQSNVAAFANAPAGSNPTVTALKPFTRLVVFGDSLSDGGAYTVWASGAASGKSEIFVGATILEKLAAAAPYGGKFTTNPGKVWVENLAAKVGYDLKPANLMGGGIPSMNLSLPQLGGCTTCTNYAQGGSRVALQPGIGNAGTTANPANAAVSQAGFAGNAANAPVPANPVLVGAATADYTVTNTFLGAATLPVTQQIDQHLASSYVTNGQFAATDLVIVLAGANDVFTQAGLAGAGAITGDAAGVAVGTAAGALVQQVGRLKAAGAKHVLVVGLPDMGVTPYGASAGPATAGALTALSRTAFNSTLTTYLANVAGVAYLDPAPLFSAVVTSPSTYGFTKVIDSTSAQTAIESTACGPNAIAQVAAGDSAESPSSLFCSAKNAGLSILGSLRALLADQTYVFADGVHPTAQMHKVLADHVQQKIGLLLINAMASAPAER